MPQATKADSTIQSRHPLRAAASAATARGSEIEWMGKELARVQALIDDCGEAVRIWKGPEFEKEGPDRDAFRDVQQALNYAERRHDALLRMLSTMLPLTLAEVQVMQVIAMERSRFVRECHHDDDDKEILKNLEEAIRDGIAKITGQDQAEIGMLNIGSASWIRPVLRDLPADQQRIREAHAHVKKVWRARPRAVA